MGEKLKVPYITDTVLVNGVYLAEQRDQHSDRRRITKKVVRYERRQNKRDPRLSTVKTIDVFV